MNRLFQPIHLIAGLCLAMVLGCGRSDRLVVYADPWMSPFADKAIAEFGAEHPDMEIEMRSLSSEVIVQHLHYGQPMDVFLCFRPEILEENKLGDAIGEKYPLADVEVVLAEPLSSLRQKELGADTCLVVAASGRPLRILTEESTTLPTDFCILYGDFCRQTQDYLLRGWVAAGYVPSFFVEQHADRLRIVERKKKFPGAFSAVRLKEARHPAQADLFMDFLRSEKCKSLLAEERIIP